MNHWLNFPRLLSLASILLGSILIIAPGLLLPVDISKAAGLSILTLGLLAAAQIPEYLTALLFFLVAILFGVAPTDVIFSGFASSAMWLVFGGLVIGVAIMSTGLGKRTAAKLAGYLEGSYIKLITGMTAVGLVFAFIMPSGMGRVMLLVPIAMAIANHFGFQKDSNGFAGIVLATTLSTFIPAFSILPANVPNMVLVGMAESQLGLSPLYGEYLLLHFPILGLFKAGIIIFLIVWLFPDTPKVINESELHESGSLSRDEVTLGVVLAVLLLLWFSDFIHHISPAWIALAGALFLLFPRIGVVSNQDFNTKVNFSSLFFVAGVIGLGGVIQYSGLGTAVGKVLIESMPLHKDSGFVNYISVALASSFTGLVTTLPGVPAVITPMTGEIVNVTGLPVKTVLMLQVLGFSTMILPYQAPPVIVALHLTGCTGKDAMKPILLLALITYVLLLPINYIWWQLVGWI